MKEDYYNSIILIEKLHRLFLDVIKTKLKSINVKDINNIQCSVLYNIGSTELTVGTLTKKGYYLGSNVSYNLRKMEENGYIFQRPSEIDKRESIVSLTDKGLELHDKLDDLFSHHVDGLLKVGMNEDSINR